MGGEGSTRWGGYQRKLTVDACYQFPIGSILPYLRRGWGEGKRTWLDLRLHWVFSRGSVDLRYGRREERILVVRGQRWFWQCPSCDTRVSVLYLPDRTSGWACRQCHDLTYTSTQARRKPTKEYQQFLAQLEQRLRQRQRQRDRSQRRQG